MKSFSYALLAFLVVFFAACSSSKTIVNGLDEKEANEILVYLSSKGIEAQKIPSTAGGTGGGSQKALLWDIAVEEEDAREAMALLNQAGLPRRQGQNLLNIFRDTGLVPSELQDKIRYQAGLAEQIASTIRKIDGVLDAEVQISFPEEDPLNPSQKKGKITASVYVKHSGVLDDPNSHLLTKIKRLVTASVTGLDYENVTVIPDRARFSELAAGSLQSSFEEDKQYVNVWGIILAKESLTKFRTIFFTFISLILLLILSLIWFFWKVSPLLESHGGFKSLFKLHAMEEGTKKGGEIKKKERKADKESLNDESDDEGEEEEEEETFSKKSSLQDKIKAGQQAISKAGSPKGEVPEEEPEENEEEPS